MQKIVFRIIGCVLTALFAASTAWACSCSSEDIWLSDVVAESEYIFIGTVIAAVHPDFVDSSSWRRGSTITYRIDKWFKSNTGLPSLDVQADAKGTSCSIPHHIGSKRLIFARKNKAGSEYYVDGMCAPSTYFSSRDVIKYFETGKDRFTQGGWSRLEKEANPFANVLFDWQIHSPHMGCGVDPISTIDALEARPINFSPFKIPETAQDWAALVGALYDDYDPPDLRYMSLVLRGMGQAATLETPQHSANMAWFLSSCRNGFEADFLRTQPYFHKAAKMGDAYSMRALITHGLNNTPGYGGKKTAQKWLNLCLQSNPSVCEGIQKTLDKREVLSVSDPDGLADYIAKYATYDPAEPF